MRIQYKATGHQRDVSDVIGARLVGSRIADLVHVPAVPEPMPRRAILTRALKSVEDDPVPEEEISPRTGKPKRRYRRRDMRAED